MSLPDAALAWYDAGFCVLPAAKDATKRPLSTWTEWQEQRPTREQIQRWFSEDQDGMGLITGFNELEMFELEGRAVAEGMHEQLIHLLNQADPELLTKLMTYVEKTPSGGLHWLYRVDGPIPGSTKLARRQGPKTEDNPTGIEVFIETRGKPAWTIAAPSAGRTHPTGKAWETIAGQPGVVATLTVEEHAVLHEIARTFDRMPAAMVPPPMVPSGPRGAGERAPGDDFNEKATWDEILRGSGWVPVHRRGEITYWRRPGKTTGISATTGFGEGDWFYPFTTSTEFDQRTYTKFGTYALIEHHGNYEEASRELRRRGYGDPLPTDRVLTLIPGGREAPAGAGGDGGVSETTGEILGQPDPPQPTLVTTSLTDVGNAQLLIAAHAHRLRYVPERGHWLTWQGTRWEWAPDDSPVVQAMIATISSIEPADDAQAKFKLRSLNYRPMQQAILAARTDPALQVRLHALDADPYALNTPSGVVDLRTGQHVPGRPDDLHTRITRVPYDPAASSAGWLQFLAETFDGDVELITFLQRLTGYSITGKVTHHVLPFLHGSGGNGKTVFIETVLRVIGDYGTTAPPDFLLSGGREDEAATARLAGQRMVVCSEVNQSAKFNEAKIKLLTGGDTITARFLYQEHFTFTPSHQLWLMANHQPRVDAGGEGFWRRLRLVPFTRTVPAAQRIEGLAEDFVAAEGPGILRWAVDGARQCLREGLGEPEAVLAATALYAEEEDHLGRFIEERLLIGGGSAVRIDTHDVRAAYEQWCFIEGEKAITPQMFGREMRSRGMPQIRSNGRRFYTNTSLLGSENFEDRRPEQLRGWDQ